MTDWILVPCLAKLRDEFNAIAPNRAKGADGSVGDLAHQERVSDHNPDETGSVPIHDADHVNEVHALDITTDLREPDLTLEDVVQFLLARCRSGAEKRLRYIIFNRRIWRADNGWRQETYTGTSDPHINHAHFSAQYITSLESDTSTWHLEELVAITQADVDLIWGKVLDNPYTAEADTTTAGGYLRYAPSLSGIVNGVAAKLAPQFAALAAAVGADDVDEQAIAAGVLAGLTPQALAAAITAAGLTPEAIAAAIPPDLAGQVADELGARISRPAAPPGA